MEEYNSSENIYEEDGSSYERKDVMEDRIRDILPSPLERGLDLPESSNWAESFGRSGSAH